MTTTLRRTLRPLGWLVIVGGTLTSVGVFYIDHMNPSLWMAMAISVAVSVAVGAVVLRVAERRARKSPDRPHDERAASQANGNGP
jgi:membrane protein implicated in regulation of membrane protease activity